MSSLLELYQNHVLGDGHGLTPVSHPVAAASDSPVVVPESLVQRRKRHRHEQEQARQIAARIREFRALGDCDHD